MKKLTLITMFFVLFLGTCCHALESDKATFFGKRECTLINGSHAQRCKLGWGDTLSGLARAAYGHGNLYSRIKDANPNIVDANKIQAYEWIIIPDVPSTSTAAAPATPRAQAQPVATPAAPPLPDPAKVQTIVTESTPEFPAGSPMESTTSIPSTDHAIAAMVKTISAQPPESSPTPIVAPSVASPPIAGKKAKGSKITGYQSVVNGVLQGKLQTQLLLFNSKEEKRLGLPIERIDLKPSLAVPAKDGTSIVSIHLKKLPTQPFELLVGGINDPIDSTQIRPYSGKTPGEHSFLWEIGKMGARGGISLALTGNPFIALGVIAGPPMISLAIAQHEKASERKVAAAQAAVDKSKLALYRASLESNSLSAKEN